MAKSLKRRRSSPTRSFVHVARAFCGSWLCANNRSARTIRAYRIDLVQFGQFRGHGTRSLHSITAEDILKWVTKLQRDGLAAASIRRKLAALRSLYGFALRFGMVEKSPLSDLRLQLGEVRRITEVVPDKQLRVLLRHTQSCAAGNERDGATNWLAVRDHAIVRLFAATAIRVGELVELKVSALDLSEEIITVMGKGRRERVVPLVHRGDTLCIKRYLAVKPPSEFLFICRSGQPMTTDAVRAMLRRTAADAGMTARPTPHQFRHTAATRLLENGADLRVVQVLLGHQSIRTTERYTHVNAAHLKRALTKYHPLSRRAA